MADREINIRLTLKDDLTATLTKVTNSLTNSNKQLEVLGQNFVQTGRQMSRFGGQMMMFGAIGLSPFILSMRTASKENVFLRERLFALNQSFEKLQATLAQYLLPHVDRLNRLIENLDKEFAKISPSTKQFIADTIIIGSVVLIGVGAVIKLAGVLKILAGAIMLTTKAVQDLAIYMAVLALENPVIATIVAVTAVIVALGVAMYNLNDSFKRFVNEGWKEFTSVDWGKAFVDFNIALAKAPWKIFNPIAVTQEAVKAVKDATEEIVDLERIVVVKHIGIMQDFYNKMKELQTGFSLEMQVIKKELNDFGKVGAKVARDLVGNMQTTFSSFFQDAFTGQLKKAKDYFNAFGQSLLKTFSDVIAQMLVRWILFSNQTGGAGTSGLSKAGGIMGAMASIAGAFSGGGGTTAGAGGSTPVQDTSGATMTAHTGGIVRMHGGYGLAKDEVPAVLQTGEGILNRKGLANLGSENLHLLNKGGRVGGGGLVLNYNPVIILKAWDTADVYAQRKAISNVFADELINNGSIRRLTKQYVK